MSAPVSFWSSYHASKRPSEVEEPSDWFQRPLGYVVAKLAMATTLTPNALTGLSALFAVAGGISIGAHFAWHLQVGGGLLVISAVFDASDGQLARMRGTASANGRMIDGLADLVGAIAAVSGVAWYFWDKWRSPWQLGAALLVASVATAVTGSFHTALYDHYKNVWMRLTYPASREGEGHDEVQERAKSRAVGESLSLRILWSVYLFYTSGQADTVRRYDPFTTPDLGALPSYDPARAATYRRECGRAMNVWRLFFGFGTVIVGIGVFAALDMLEVYMVARLLLLNGLFYGWLRREQRRASRRALGAGSLTAGSS